MKEYLKNEITEIQQAGLHRKMRIVASMPGREIIIDGKKCLNFSSNNYLNFAEHPEVIKASAEAAAKYGAGGAASRLISGTTELHLELEKKLAELKGAEACLVFPTGYQANIGAVTALIGAGDCMIMDELNHASLWDAAKLSKARLFVYPHRDMESLEKLLRRSKDYKHRLVVTDSLFSMDGDIAPLEEIAALAKRYDGWTMIDEAHATGVFGEKGAGLAEYFEVEDKIDIIMGTLSKAVGSQGGFICGSKELIEYLVNRSRSFIYTTSLAPSSAGAALKAIELINKEPQRRKTLLENAGYLREKLKQSNFDILNSESQIVPAVTGDAAATLKLSEKLFEQGIYAPAIRPPTVPEGKCRLRFSLTYSHTKQDIDKLVDAIL